MDWNTGGPQVMLELDQILRNKLLWKWPQYKAAQYNRAILTSGQLLLLGAAAVSCKYTRFLETSSWLSCTGGSASLSPARTPVHNPAMQGVHTKEHTQIRKWKIQKKSVVTEASQHKSGHSSCSLDMVFVRRNRFKQLNPAKTLKPLPDILLKDA